MAYITAAQTKSIKTALAKAFPKFKFSVRNRHFSSVSINIMEGPTNFGSESGYDQLNHFYFENYKDGDILKAMRKVVQQTVSNYDNSDLMTDYHDVGYYESWSVGKWNKDFKLTV